MPTYYSIKYALSSNGQIVSFESDRPPSEHGYVYPGDRWASSQKVGKDCFVTPDEAIAAFEIARTKKIATLHKQIAALEKMRPTIAKPESPDPDPAGKAPGER